MSALEFRDIEVRFGRGPAAIRAVDRVSLDVPSGAVVGLVGESGSGKSTLARTAVGLAPLHSGAVVVDGEIQRGGRRRSRAVQMVYQDPYSSLDPRMTVGDSIAEALSPEVGRRPAARRDEVARLLELVNLDPARADDLPRGLSGGQRQRIALARALGSRPRYIVADEITSALDVSVQGAVLNLVREIQRELGFGMLFISHNLAVVRYISDQVAVMRLGELVEQGPASQVLDDPRHPYTRTLLDAAPRLRARPPR